MASGGNGGGSSGDCEGEEQEDPLSSSFHDVLVVSAELNADLTVDDKDPEKKFGDEELSAFRQQWQQELDGPEPLQEDVEKAVEVDLAYEEKLLEDSSGRSSRAQDISGDDELAAFRQQWQRELEATPTPQKETENKVEDEPTTEEEKAKKYFLKGAELERSGKWYEAIQQYKRAITIMPDIEWRLYESTKGTETPQEEAETVEEAPVNTNTEEEDDEEAVEGEEVVARLLRIQARRGLVCTPAVPMKGGHISWLPYEVVVYLLRWVVSAELDAAALERAGAACRALHVAARDPDLWRDMCVRTWGLECGSPRQFGLGSWRHMFVRRPRLQLNGCYISKTTYLRHGENSFQDYFYRPWYLVDYYRYLRFFPEGLVLMWTTAEEPVSCVQQLRLRTPRAALGIMSGHYRLIGDKVVIVIKKSSSEKKLIQATNTRFRARRKDAEQEYTQTFHIELELRCVRGRRNAALSWRGYRVCGRRDQWTQFDITPRNYPPFAFSRVRAYTREARAPL